MHAEAISTESLGSDNDQLEGKADRDRVVTGEEVSLPVRCCFGRHEATCNGARALNVRFAATVPLTHSGIQRPRRRAWSDESLQARQASPVVCLPCLQGARPLRRPPHCSVALHAAHVAAAGVSVVRLARTPLGQGQAGWPSLDRHWAACRA